MPQDSVPKKVCVCCGAESKMMCARCDDNYCSVDCQKKDWARHRPICFKMPMLVPDLESLEQKMMTMSLTPMKSPPEAEVSTMPSAVGDTKENISSRTDGAKPASSAGSLISQQIEKITVDGSKPSSKLDIQNLLDKLSKPTLKFIGTSNSSVEPSKVQPLMMSDLKKRRYPQSKIVKVKMQGMLERKVMRLVEDTKQVEEYIKKIEDATQKFSQGKLRSPNYMPVKDEIVLSLYEGEWFRACVLDPREDGCIIQYIEYGNMETVPPGELMPASSELAFDICARDFIIDNAPETFDDKQKDILLSTKFSITNIRKMPDGLNHCTIFGF